MDIYVISGGPKEKYIIAVKKNPTLRLDIIWGSFLSLLIVLIKGTVSKDCNENKYYCFCTYEIQSWAMGMRQYFVKASASMRQFIYTFAPNLRKKITFSYMILKCLIAVGHYDMIYSKEDSVSQPHAITL